MEAGNIETKKSTFRVRTKVGSSHGLRQSALLTDSNIYQQRPNTKEEERFTKKQTKDNPLANALKGSDNILSNDIIVDDKDQDRMEILETTDDYVLKTFRQAKSSGIKNQGLLKMSKLYDYGETEIFSTRFSPDDGLLAIGILTLDRIVNWCNRNKVTIRYKEVRSISDLSG